MVDIYLFVAIWGQVSGFGVCVVAEWGYVLCGSSMKIGGVNSVLCWWISLMLNIGLLNSLYLSTV